MKILLYIDVLCKTPLLQTTDIRHTVYMYVAISALICCGWGFKH